MNFFGFSSFFSIISVLIAVFIIGTIIFVFANIIKEWNKNNHSPKLSVPAVAVSRRAQRSDDSTWYYITFQVESGDRMEFMVNSSVYGTIIEGDFGKLTFQGSRYLDFDRFNRIEEKG